MATITSALQQDSAGNNVQVTAKFICQDGSDTPKTSPLVFTTSGLTLVVPDDAYELVATPTNDLFVYNVPAVPNNSCSLVRIISGNDVHVLQ